MRPFCFFSEESPVKRKKQTKKRTKLKKSNNHIKDENNLPISEPKVQPEDQGNPEKRDGGLLDSLDLVSGKKTQFQIANV